MPRVVFSCPPAQIHISRSMRAPKKFQSLPHWFKEARKAIPNIPNVDDSDWAIHKEMVTVGSIIWELRDSVGNQCAVLIERRANLMVA